MRDLTAELKKKLNPKHVRIRQKGNTELSYVEAWQMIEEANNIFGFDGWKRETIYNKEVCRYAYNDKNKVGYEAKVVITIGDVKREGTGHGSGIAKDLFDAIEGAAKEAESDAMKRALMTFGYRFGLALYDKEQKHVGLDKEDLKKADTIYAEQNAKLLDAKTGEQFKEDWSAGKEARAELKGLNMNLHNQLVTDMQTQAEKWKGE